VAERRPSETDPQAAAALADGSEELAEALVLVVDDHEQNRELLLAYLESLGCRTLAAADGLEAETLLAEHTPDLVLLDIMMPRMSGYQLCSKLKSDPATRDIPVIMVTALSEVGDVERAVESGADDFLTKPVTKVELLTRARSLLRLRLLRKQLDRAMRQMRTLTEASETGVRDAAAEDDAAEDDPPSPRVD